MVLFDTPRCVAGCACARSACLARARLDVAWQIRRWQRAARAMQVDLYHRHVEENSAFRLFESALAGNGANDHASSASGDTDAAVGATQPTRSEAEPQSIQV